jgi:hypothetical protein
MTDSSSTARDEAQDDDRVAERAHLLPEEIAAGSADPTAQAEQILAESDDRTDNPERTQRESKQANESDAGNSR